ncbi:MAG TPA: NAD(P)/FAD-dependent oxidoreductase [Terriglobales bacterium]|nr:NAD(P)/FAD-dependent oxidoreductase [Terriglobales bacterium]
MSADVLIIGAGVAGLRAAIDLARAGMRVEIIEARDRIGGRILTVHDRESNHPIELGAEFVHGMAPEIWLPLQQHDLKATEVDGDLWCSIDGKVQRCNFFAEADKILEEMNDTDADESFLDFLTRRFPGDDQAEAKRWATGYVSGFNAADPGLVSVHWLVHSREADEQIYGDRAFRIAGGYEKLLKIFKKETKALNVPIHLNTVVSSVEWRTGSVAVHAISDGNKVKFNAPRVLITLPLGVLQARDSVHFQPALPNEKKVALEKLVMGKVVRVTLCFHQRFWEDLRGIPDSKPLGDLSFLFSRNDVFPTWWTEMPDPVPIITGWSASHSTDELAGLGEDAVINKAIESLSTLLQIGRSEVESKLRAPYFHDWDADPFSRGAYSYVEVGGEGCQRTLGEPVANTLFFAGEATDTTGHNGTVHGAMASGHRAAKEIHNSR